MCLSPCLRLWSVLHVYDVVHVYYCFSVGECATRYTNALFYVLLSVRRVTTELYIFTILSVPINNTFDLTSSGTQVKATLIQDYSNLHIPSFSLTLRSSCPRNHVEACVGRFHQPRVSQRCQGISW